MKRVKLGKRYKLKLRTDQGKLEDGIRNVKVNCLFKGKVVFLDEDNRSYFTFTTNDVKQMHKDGDIK